MSAAFSWHDQFAGAVRDSAQRLLDEAIGRDRTLSEGEIDRLLADLTYFTGTTWFEVPELDSLVLNDDLSLIENTELRHKLRSWRTRNDFFKSSVHAQATFVNDRFLPFLDENALMQQIYNVSASTPGGDPDDKFPAQTMELRVTKAHSSLLDNLLFQNLLARRVLRLDMMLTVRDSEYVTELQELIALIEQELSG